MVLIINLGDINQFHIGFLQCFLTFPWVASGTSRDLSKSNHIIEIPWALSKIEICVTDASLITQFQTER